jgi:hypothetical protein
MQGRACSDLRPLGYSLRSDPGYRFGIRDNQNCIKWRTLTFMCQLLVSNDLRR